MKIYTALNYEELSQKCADLLVEQVLKKPDSLICLASGGSPQKGYELFTKKIKADGIDVSRLRFIKLDEWWKLPPEDPSTCEKYVKDYILDPLHIDKHRYIGFRSDCECPEKECRRISEALKKSGGIDLCILGIGKNGHLGLNEPNDIFIENAHVALLDEKTKTHNLLSLTNHKIQKGMTLGISDLMHSEKILFLISGKEKKVAFREFMKGTILARLPATVLKLHRNVICVVEDAIQKSWHSSAE